MIDARPSTVGLSIPSVEPKAITVVHVVTIVVALGLQGLGLYAIWVIFGAWITLALYAVGGLAVLLQHVIAGRRAASCSAGD
jgi:hypothetical protein